MDKDARKKELSDELNAKVATMASSTQVSFLFGKFIDLQVELEALKERVETGKVSASAQTSAEGLVKRPAGQTSGNTP